jgi:hypothetical protein
VLGALCYGKLPIYKDFLKSRNGDSSEKFQGWLNGLDRLIGRPAKIPRTQRVMFLPESGKEYVLATVWDSSDQGGVRAFPFTLYFEPSRRFLASITDQVVFGNLSLWEVLEREKPGLAAARSAQDFYQRLRGVGHHLTLSVASVEEGQFWKEAHGTSVKALATAIFGGEAVDGWVRLLWRALLALGPAGRATSIVPTLALRLPLGTGIAYHLQVETWIKFIRERGSNTVPSVIFPRDPVEGSASFCLFFRPIRESDVRLLLEEAKNSEILDLTAPDPHMEVIGFGEFHEAASEWLARPEANLWSLLPQNWNAKVS